MRGLRDLTVVNAADLAGARSWADFGRLLSQLKVASNLSLTGIQRRAKQLKLVRPLPPATVSAAMNGSRPSREVVSCLIKVFEVTPEEDWLGTWQRLAEIPAADPAPRFDEVSPRRLGIHAAITADGSSGDLPEYVARDFDDDLRRRLSAGIQGGCFVLLVGRSSSGKTRSMYEAVRTVVPNWPIVQPETTSDLVELLGGTRRRIIVWLDEMHRFFGSDLRLTREHVTRLLQFPAIVVATLWPEDYLRRKTPRGPSGSPELENDRRLVDLAEVVSVPEQLSTEERATAERIAKADPRIRLALEVQDAGLTQVLAAGPDLLHRWEHAPDPHAKAVISFAADARRLGHLAPITEAAFRSAAGGYLTSAQRVNPSERWLTEALEFACQELHGAVAALTPVDDGQGGQLTGYVVADYLAQHVRRADCPPRKAWEVLIANANEAEDLRRLAAAAHTRMRYRYEEQALQRLFELHGEGAAELAAALFRRGRADEAVRLTGSSGRFADLAERTDELRGAADRHLVDLFFDGGKADELRRRADAGSQLFEEDLAALLAERGAVDELRERADRGLRPAANALAELLATHGRVDELEQRAGAGDESAARQLRKLRASDPAVFGTAVEAQVADLRRRARDGNEAAAVQLTTLLFDLRDEPELRREVDAGTFQAAERLVALLNADETVDHTVVDRLRMYGLDANGDHHIPWGGVMKRDRDPA